MKKRSLIPIAKNPKGVTLKSERQTLQIAFLFPLFLSLLVLVLVPMASLLGLSFTNYKMTGGRFRFIGLENYIDSVSYTHLDVYKRQQMHSGNKNCSLYKRQQSKRCLL